LLLLFCWFLVAAAVVVIVVCRLSELVKIRVTVVEKNDDPLRSASWLRETRDAVCRGSVQRSFGLAAAVNWWGFVAFRVGIEPLIGLVNTSPFELSR
jgi:hypothetical protein